MKLILATILAGSFLVSLPGRRNESRSREPPLPRVPVSTVSPQRVLRLWPPELRPPGIQAATGGQLEESTIGIRFDQILPIAASGVSITAHRSIPATKKSRRKDTKNAAQQGRNHENLTTKTRRKRRSSWERTLPGVCGGSDLPACSSPSWHGRLAQALACPAQCSLKAELRTCTRHQGKI